MWFLAVFIIGTIVVGIINRVEKDKAEEKRKEQAVREHQELQQQRENYEKEREDLIARLGNCVVDIEYGMKWKYSFRNRFMVFEESKVVIIDRVEYNFSQILEYSMVDDATSETITTSVGKAKTSTGNMIGRAVVGGVLTGGIGAVAGAATAKKNISTDATSRTTTKHNYTLYVNVNSLENSTINIRVGEDAQKAHKIANVLNVIIERSKD